MSSAKRLARAVQVATTEQLLSWETELCNKPNQPRSLVQLQMVQQELHKRQAQEQQEQQQRQAEQDKRFAQLLAVIKAVVEHGGGAAKVKAPYQQRRLSPARMMGDLWSDAVIQLRCGDDHLLFTSKQKTRFLPQDAQLIALLSNDELPALLLKAGDVLGLTSETPPPSETPKALTLQEFLDKHVKAQNCTPDEVKALVQHAWSAAQENAPATEKLKVIRRILAE
jgi:hypothetical protein